MNVKFTVLSISRPFRSGNVSFCPGNFFFLFWPCSEVCGILVPQPETEPMILQWSLNYWATGEVRFYIFHFDSGPWCAETKRGQSTFNTEAEFLPADSGKKRKKGRKKRSKMLHCTICTMSKLLDNTKEK